MLYFGPIEDGRVFCLGYDQRQKRLPKNHFLAVGPNRKTIRRSLRYPNLKNSSFLKDSSSGVEVVNEIPLWEYIEKDHEKGAAYNNALRQALEDIFEKIQEK